MITPWINYNELQRIQITQQNHYISPNNEEMALLQSNNDSEHNESPTDSYESSGLEKKQLCKQKRNCLHLKKHTKKYIIRKRKADLIDRNSMIESDSLVYMEEQQRKKEKIEELLSVIKVIQTHSLNHQNIALNPTQSMRSVNNSLRTSNFTKLRKNSPLHTKIKKHTFITNKNKKILDNTQKNKAIENTLCNRTMMEEQQQESPDFQSTHHKSLEEYGVQQEKTIPNNQPQIYDIGMIYSKRVKSPFTAIFEIDDFLRLPTSGNIIQHTVNFLDRVNQTHSSEDHSQFLHTELYDAEPLRFRLLHTTINEIVNISTDIEKHTKLEVFKTVFKPIHTTSKKKRTQFESKNEGLEVTVPVVVGEYEFEITMSIPILFEHDILTLKEISKRVVLKHCDFIPIQFGRPLSNGTRTVSKAKVLLKGDIIQAFKYSAKPKQDNHLLPQKQKNCQLQQKVDINLSVLFSQIQKIKTILVDGK